VPRSELQRLRGVTAVYKHPIEGATCARPVIGTIACEKAQENSVNDSYAYRTKRGDERTRRNAPDGACGANKVETSRGLGLALLNINLTPIRIKKKPIRNSVI